MFKFVSSKKSKERIEICRSCENYLPLLGNCKLCGCFMKLKVTLAGSECADKNNLRWGKEEGKDDLIEMKTGKYHREHLKHLMEVWPKIENGKIENEEQKHITIGLFNTMFNTNYELHTNCQKCLHTIWKGFKGIVDEIGLDKNCCN